MRFRSCRGKRRYFRPVHFESLESRRVLALAPPIIYGFEEAYLQDHRAGHTYQYRPFAERGPDVSVDEELLVSRGGFYTAKARIEASTSNGVVTAEAYIEQDWHTQWNQDYFITAHAGFFVYVRGVHGTPFFLDAVATGSVSVQSYGPTGTASASMTGLTGYASATEVTGSASLTNRHYFPEGIATQGHPFDPFLFTFPEYPGVTYSRVFGRSIGGQVWSNTGTLYGDRVVSEGTVNLTARAYLRQGLPPIVAATGATFAVAGAPVTWHSVSFDEDVVGQTRQELYSQQWELLDPAGQVVATGTGVDFQFTPTTIGEYRVRLTGVDDEWMDGTQTYTVQVQNAPPTLALIQNITLAAGTATQAVALNAGDTNHALGQLTIVATASNATLFPAGSVQVVAQGDTRELSLAPAIGLSGVSRITVTVTDPLGASAVREFLVSVGDLPASQQAAGITGPSAQTIDEDTQLVLSAANNTGVTITAPPGGSAQQRLSITATHGSITLATTNGLTFEQGDGVADSAMVFRGSRVALNAALTNAFYLPDEDYYGPARVNFRVDDFGQSGLGFDLLSAWELPLTILPVADITRIHAPTEVIWNHETPLVLSAASGNGVSIEIPEIDRVEVRLHAERGTFTLASTAGLVVTVGDGINDSDFRAFGSSVSVNLMFDAMQIAFPGPRCTLEIKLVDALGVVTTHTIHAWRPGFAEFVLRDNLSSLEWRADTLDGLAGSTIGTDEYGPFFTANSFIGDGHVLKSIGILVIGLQQVGQEYLPTDDLTELTWHFGFYESLSVLQADPELNNQPIGSINRFTEFESPSSITAAGSIEDYNVYYVEIDVQHLGLRTTMGQEQWVVLASRGTTTFAAVVLTQSNVGAVGTGIDRIYDRNYYPSTGRIDDLCFSFYGQDCFYTQSQSVLVTSISDNAPPEIDVPDQITTPQNASVVLTGENAIQVSDIDAGSGNLEVNLSITHGSVTLASPANLSFLVGDGSADGEVKFQGTLAAINTALGGMTFTPETDYYGAAAITITANDLGNRGAGGPKTDTHAVSIAISPVSPFSPVANHSTFSTFQGVQVSGNFSATDSDDAALTYSVTMPPILGTLTAINPATGAFTYTPNPGATGLEVITFAVSDGPNTVTGQVRISIQTPGSVVTATGGNISVPGNEGRDFVLVSTLSPGQARVRTQDLDTGLSALGTYPLTGSITVSTGAGNDRIDVSSMSHESRLDAGDGNDVVSGSSGNDVIDGGSGNDQIFAGAGNDFINAGEGNDTVAAGDGDDRVFGGAGNDKLSGGAGHDVVSGNGDNDLVEGSSGNDLVVGGAGADNVTGGADADLVVAGELTSGFASVAGNADDLALIALLDSWNASHPAGLLSGQVSGDDGAGDSLVGNEGDDDFYASVTDNLADLNGPNLGSDRLFSS